MTDELTPGPPLRVIDGGYDGHDDIEDFGTDPTFEELATVARRMMLKAIGRVDWSGYKAVLANLYDEGDVNIVLKFMAAAEVDVFIDYGLRPASESL